MARSALAEQLAAIRGKRRVSPMMAPGSTVLDSEPAGSPDAAEAVPRTIQVAPVSLAVAIVNGKATHQEIPEGMDHQIPDPMTPAEAKALAVELGIPSPRDLGLGLWGVCCFVTPEMAYAWLTTKNSLNRNQTESQVGRLTSDILEDNWRLIHQGVGFRCDGRLQDGQHRLTAIVEANRPCALLVVLNVDDEARMAIDGTLSRQAHHVAALMGLSWTKTQLSTAKRAQLGIDPGSKTPWSNQHVVALAERHAEAMAWLYSPGRFHVGGRVASVSPVVAACLRAYYHVDKDRLDDFIHVLMHGAKRDGTLGPEDDGARILSKWLVNESGNMNTRALATSADIYARTCSALRSFLARKPTSKLYAIDREIYALPE